MITKIMCPKCKSTEHIKLYQPKDKVMLACEECKWEIDVSSKSEVDKAWAVADFYHSLLSAWIVYGEMTPYKVHNIELEKLAEYL
jgi:uncharacterized protein (DUF983 family)